jgi:hypothetical protein
VFNPVHTKYGDIGANDRLRCELNRAIARDNTAATLTSSDQIPVKRGIIWGEIGHTPNTLCFRLRRAQRAECESILEGILRERWRHGQKYYPEERSGGDQSLTACHEMTFDLAVFCLYKLTFVLYHCHRTNPGSGRRNLCFSVIGH